VTVDLTALPLAWLTNALLTLALLALLLVGTWSDFKHNQRVPFWVMYGLLAGGATGALVHGQWLAAVAALAVALASSAPDLVLPRGARIALSLAGAFGASALADGNLNLTIGLIGMFSAWLLWELHFMGGADATAMVALLAFYSHAGFLWWLLAVTAASGLVELALRFWGTAPLLVLQSAQRLATGRVPTRQELETQGTASLWRFAAAGITYAAWLALAH
jgi:Flp pilus assembly protein protease CpaA